MAAYYTILNQITGKTAEYPIAGYSADPEPKEIYIDSESEFSHLVNGRNPQELWSLVDELVSAVSVVNPRLYDSFMRKIEE